MKTLLTDNQVLDKKYKEIDYLVYNKEFDNFYKKDKLYNILYINENNEKLYDYRALLAKYNVPSLVLYPSDVNSGNTSIMFNTELGIEANVYEKLPILIKIKNKNIVKSKTNVTLDEFEKLIKE